MSAQIIPTRTQAETGLADVFGATKATLPGNAQVIQLREEAFGAFAEAGLPHRRVEAWHYTDLRTVMREALPIAPAPSADAIAALKKELSAAPAPAGVRLVLVDGVFVAELSDLASLPAGVTVRSLASVLAEGPAELIESLNAKGLGKQDAIVSLNAALMQDGVIVEVAPGTAVTDPINVVYATATTAPMARFSRSLVVVGKGASVRVTEASHGEGGRTGQTYGCLIFAVGDEASLDHTTMITQTAAASQRLESFMATIGEKAKLNSFALVSGNGLLRRQIFVRFEGADAEGNFSGISLLRGREHADTTLLVEHTAPGCTSREAFRYILDEEATGVFQGKITVAPIAQKTDGKMLSKALLLSENASMNNKPELEIFADDVACGHGATCGGLNEDQLFYLQARGLPSLEAKALLLEAFAAELVDEINDEALSETYRAEVRKWLGAKA